jgi:hypothetical protein
MLLSPTGSRNAWPRERGSDRPGGRHRDDWFPRSWVSPSVLGTHQGAVSHSQLDYYLDEFTFRFNRRRARHRGLLFYRLLEGAVAADPHPYKTLTSQSVN